MCRLAETLQADPPDDGACLIRVENRLLVISLEADGKYVLPGGYSQPQQSAQCTAHHHTWMQTGFNVEVRQYLGTNAQGKHFYQCNLAGDFSGELTHFPVPDWAPLQISRIEFIDPFAIDERQWHGGNELTVIRGMFNKVK